MHIITPLSEKVNLFKDQRRFSVSICIISIKRALFLCEGTTEKKETRKYKTDFPVSIRFFQLQRCSRSRMNRAITAPNARIISIEAESAPRI